MTWTNTCRRQIYISEWISSAMASRRAAIERQARLVFRKLNSSEKQESEALDAIPRILSAALDLCLKRKVSLDWCGRMFQIFIKFDLPPELEKTVGDGATILDDPVAPTTEKLQAAKALQQELQAISSAGRGRR